MYTEERVSISAFVDPDDHERLVERARLEERSVSAALRLAIRRYLTHRRERGGTMRGFERSARMSSLPKSWRVDGQGRKVDVSEEQKAKAERQAAAVARVAANELKRGNRHESQ